VLLFSSFLPVVNPLSVDDEALEGVLGEEVEEEVKDGDGSWKGAKW
jgi:hypothetical protein